MWIYIYICNLSSECSIFEIKIWCLMHPNIHHSTVYNSQDMEAT